MRFVIRVESAQSPGNPDLAWRVSISCPAIDAIAAATAAATADPAAAVVAAADSTSDSAVGFELLTHDLKAEEVKGGPKTGWRFPWRNESAAPDVQELLRNHKAIQERQASSDIGAFGLYLFNTLIGETAWKKIQKAAEDHNANFIELALSWDAREKDLHRLYWEAMASPQGPLAAERVAISRLITDAVMPVRVIQLPLRLLFVVGKSLSDPDLKPGAEFFGLIRQIQCSDRSRCVNSRIVQNGTPQDIKNAVGEFQPDIVHFICHGELDGLGQAYLSLPPDPKKPDEVEVAKQSNGLVRRSADAIVDLIRIEGNLPAPERLPAIVVLSACYTGSSTGSSMGGPVVGSFAAQIVRQGVPVVVAMSGRISDDACRLFTRTFGEALITGTPLVKATAAARRAVFSAGTPRTVDWALPGLFLAGSVEEDYSPTPSDEGDAERTLQQRIAHYDVERPPVLCSREEFFAIYDQMTSPQTASIQRPMVLLAYGERDDGRTRLIQEMTIKALKDGCFPILVGSDKNLETLTTVEGLRINLWKALRTAADAFGLELPENSKLIFLLAANQKSAEALEKAFEEWKSLTALDGSPNIALERAIYAAIVAELKNINVERITGKALQLALLGDIVSLRASAQASGSSEVSKALGRPILLLDNVHDYDKKILNDFFNEVLGKYGIGKQGQPIPVVMAASSQGPSKDILEPVIEKSRIRPWLKSLPLRPFDLDGEDLLCYERVLLHPYEGAPLPKVSRRSWIVAPDLGEEDRRKLEDRYRDYLDAKPSSLVSRDLYIVAGISRDDGLIKLADDEELLKKVNDNE